MSAIFAQFYDLKGSAIDKESGLVEHIYEKREGGEGSSKLNPMLSFSEARKEARRVCALRGFSAFAMCRIKGGSVVRLSPIMPA